MYAIKAIIKAIFYQGYQAPLKFILKIDPVVSEIGVLKANSQYLSRVMENTQVRVNPFHAFLWPPLRIGIDQAEY